MNKLSRRQILLGGFFTGAGISIATSHFRTPTKEDEKGLDMAHKTVLSARKKREIRESASLKQPTIAYSRQMSQLLVRCCRLGTEQYLQGVADSNYDGSIASLDNYFSQLDRYEQITAFQTRREHSLLEPIFAQTPLGNLIPKTELIYHGYVLKSAENNIFVFRGTQEPSEWITNINAEQIDYQNERPRALKDDVSPYATRELDEPSLGKLHQGFNSLYVKELAQPVRQVIDELDPTIPCYIAGHSLGGAMAILAAYDLALNFPKLRDRIQMYSYASPSVGDPDFAKSFNNLIPNSYRIVNLADSTWLLPPTQFSNSVYVHVGQVWSFVNQTGDVSPNHQLPAYQAAIDKEVEISTSAIDDPFTPNP